MPVTKKDVEHIARLAKLKFDDSEIERLTDEMNEILKYMDKLNEIDTTSVEPLSHPVELENVFRDDKAVDGVSTHDALKNAPVKDDKYFHVPKVIG
jgi:aspartyl-tRNA(Asn)/glutamyl-tRNA(Gln) amidotransferase subunit C